MSLEKKMEDREIQVHGSQSTLVKQQDVLMIGTPGKGGSMDIHGDISDIADFKSKIDNAKIALEYARQQLEVK